MAKFFYFFFFVSDLLFVPKDVSFVSDELSMSALEKMGELLSNNCRQCALMPHFCEMVIELRKSMGRGGGWGGRGRPAKGLVQQPIGQLGRLNYPAR